jgi:hypothetical protein
MDKIGSEVLDQANELAEMFNDCLKRFMERNKTDIIDVDIILVAAGITITHAIHQLPERMRFERVHWVTAKIAAVIERSMSINLRH